MSQTVISKYQNQVKLSPFRFADPLHSGIELGYERLHGYFSTQLSAGYLFTTTFNQAYKNYKGFRIGVEEKFFLRYRQNRYLSFEAIHQQNSFNNVELFVHDSTTTSRYFQYTDSVTVDRKALICNFKLGRQLFIKKFVKDFSFGLGFRIRSVTHEGKIFRGDKLLAPRHPNIHYGANSEKKDVAVNIPFNIRIGFRF